MPAAVGGKSRRKKKPQTLRPEAVNPPSRRWRRQLITHVFSTICASFFRRKQSPFSYEAKPRLGSLATPQLRQGPLGQQQQVA